MINQVITVWLDALILRFQLHVSHEKLVQGMQATSPPPPPPNTHTQTPPQARQIFHFYFIPDIMM